MFKSVEEIEEHFGVELSNELLLQYHGGQWSGIYSVGSRWMSGMRVSPCDTYLDITIEELKAIEERTPEVEALTAWLELHQNSYEHESEEVSKEEA